MVQTNTVDTKSKQRWTLVAMILASGVVFLDGTVVNVALPAIDRDLKAGLSGLQWIVDGYLLTLSAFLILGGALGDQYGRKRVMLFGLVGFGLTSLLCGIAPSPELLSIGRLLQGVAGAFLIPGSLAILTNAFTDAEERGRAIGNWSGWGGMTTVFGPSLGGWLVDNLSWRWVFFINVPMIAVTIWLLLTHVEETRNPQASKELDLLGALLAVAGLGGTIFALIEGPVMGWTSPVILASLIGGIVALGLFLVVEARAKNPMMPLWLFRSRNFSGANLATFGIYFGLYGGSFFVGLYLQQVLRLSAFLSGLVFLPVSFLMLFLSPQMGKLAGRYGSRLFMTVGGFIYAGGLLLLLRLQPDSNIWFDLMPSVLVMAIGLGLIVAPLTSAVMGSVDGEHSGIASAVNNVVSRVAALLAIAGLGAIVSLVFEGAITDKFKGLSAGAVAALQKTAKDPSGALTLAAQSPEVSSAVYSSYTSAFHVVILICACLVFAGGLISALMIRKS